ncbi:MAG TPA: hypothetical protein ENJ18_18665, partial [Nannocystis exedens]|nr:hypothetical protein [Nannocystis exedens]
MSQLSLNIKADVGADEHWSVLATLGLTHLAIKSELPLPTGIATALADSKLRSFVGTLPVSPNSLAGLLSGDGLDALGLQHFDTDPKRSVEIEGHPSLTRLDLLGTRIALVHLCELPELKVLQLQLVAETRLERLAKLRMVPLQGRTTLRALPSAEHLVAVAVCQDLSLEDLPSLRRIELCFETASNAVEATARAAGVEVVTDAPKPKRTKTTAPKRKVSPKQRVHPAFGLDSKPYAVLMVGKRSPVPLPEKTVKSLGTVAAWWSLDRGIHLAAIPPIGGDCGDFSCGISDVIVGQVLGYVDQWGKTVDVEPSDVQAVVEKAESELGGFWAECSGIAKNEGFIEAELALYLVACGPDAQAVLSTTEERFVWVDEQVIPYDTITMAQLATR